MTSDPFVLDYVENVFLEKFSEIFAGDTDVNVVVNLNGDADAVALTDAEAAGEHDLVLQMVFLYRVL